MNAPYTKEYLISVLKILLDIDDVEVVKYTIESLIEDIDESGLASSDDLDDK